MYFWPFPVLILKCYFDQNTAKFYLAETTCNKYIQDSIDQQLKYLFGIQKRSIRFLAFFLGVSDVIDSTHGFTLYISLYFITWIILLISALIILLESFVAAIVSRMNDMVSDFQLKKITLRYFDYKMQRIVWSKAMSWVYDVNDT